jgi:hypothetical protein
LNPEGLPKSGPAFGKYGGTFLERVDVDDGHWRLYLSRSDCRIELAVSSVTMSTGRWVARPIAPFIPAESQGC